jgi:signal transduction histidine kinase
MEQILKSTKRKFIATIIFVVVAVVTISWIVLSVYNQREIAAPAKLSEVHQSAENNPAFATYLEEQKAYEAHFIALATAIKDQESQRVTKAVAATSIIVVVLGVGIAIIAARKLMRPVVESYASQERFIQDAAHELRNPLAAMTIALQQADPKKNDPQLLTTFRRQTKRLIHINEDLLFLERSARQEPVQVNLSELLADVAEELQIVAAKKKVTLQLESDQAIMKKMIPGDYVRLTKNIIDNAVKYTKNATVVSVKQTKEKNTIHIIVKDEGIGIPTADVAHIGERFYRASNTGKIDGTGLGIAIVKKILNSYGGQLQITSTVGKGTTVHITLPA